MKNKILRWIVLTINIIVLFSVFSFIFVKSHLVFLIPKIGKIRNLLPIAKTKISENPRCYKVLNADVSYEYSSNDTLVFYVDCNTSENIFNIERFFITEDEIMLNK